MGPFVGRSRRQTSPGTPPADLLAPGLAEALVREVRPTHLLHLAWYAEHHAYWTAPQNLDWVGASLRLVRAFAEQGGTRAVLAGTCAEYDWTQGVCVEGATPIRPRGLYGVAKDAVRRVVEAFAAGAGLSAAWGRIFFFTARMSILGGSLPRLHEHCCTAISRRRRRGRRCAIFFMSPTPALRSQRYSTRQWKARSTSLRARRTPSATSWRRSPALSVGRSCFGSSAAARPRATRHRLSWATSGRFATLWDGGRRSRSKKVLPTRWRGGLRTESRRPWLPTANRATCGCPRPGRDLTFGEREAIAMGFGSTQLGSLRVPSASRQAVFAKLPLSCIDSDGRGVRWTRCLRRVCGRLRAIATDGTKCGVWFSASRRNLYAFARRRGLCQ